MPLDRYNKKNNLNFKDLISNASKIFVALTASMWIILMSAGCAPSGNVEGLNLAPLDQMPDYVQDAPREVQEAYRFAVANPDLLKQIPCFCGCNSIGHMNNLDCYVDEFGQITEFDYHAAY
jgi:hypothetical protein